MVVGPFTMVDGGTILVVEEQDGREKIQEEYRVREFRRLEYFPEGENMVNDRVEEVI